MPDTNEDLRILYNQLCTSYHSVDDFRAKLLGFLPLASGVAIFGLMDVKKDDVISQHLPEIGLFGVLITIGLLIYELKGIQKCTGFIHYGAQIEKKLLGYSPLSGQFAGLGRTDHWSWNVFNEPVASACIYASVMAAWVYVATTVKTLYEHGAPVYVGDSRLAGIIGVAVLIIVIGFWHYWSKPKDAGMPEDKKLQSPG